MRVAAITALCAVLGGACEPSTPAAVGVTVPNPNIAGFSYVVPGVLAGMPVPSADDVQGLHHHGIVHVVSLTETIPRSLNHTDVLHLPIRDFQPPTTLQQEVFVAAVRRYQQAGEPVVVHCTAGMGRTGTMLATWFVYEGMTADDAIAHVRQLRPGSIETTGQEEQIARYAALLQDEP